MLTAEWGLEPGGLYVELEFLLKRGRGKVLPLEGRAEMLFSLLACKLS